MSPAFNIVLHLEDCLKSATQTLPDAFPEPLDPMVQAADPRFGDFQANGILPYAKKHRQNPRILGEKLLGALRDLPQWDSEAILVEIAGAGFLNFKLQPKCLLQWLKSFHSKATYEKASHASLNGVRAVVDYSCPNTAKQLHVGHIRSIVIGEAIQRLLRFHGAQVIRDNHIGDWGTQFGLLLRVIKAKKCNLDEADPEQAIAQLEALYKEGSAAAEKSPEVLAEARNELVKLQRGDPENRQLWETINRISYQSYQAIYDLLGVQFDYVLGESFYRDQVEGICEELKRLGIAEEDQGALVIFHRDHPRFQKQPFIIRKSDGASNYATTDLATILYRTQEWGANRLVYVTDGRQQDHFQQLFLSTEKWFAAKKYPLPELQHAWFGTILGENGKAIKTRSGESIKLKDVLSEAIQRAYTIVQDKNPSLSEPEKQHIARVVGLGAIKYVDLLQCRTSDYIFSWDKLLSFDGNTAPYLLYAIARIHAIFRKAGKQPELQEKILDGSSLDSSTEQALARKLVAFPVVLKQSMQDLYPHYLCTYLYELAGVFSTFYNAEKVLCEDEKVQLKRLFLCQCTLSTLETGLHLLGIETLEKM